MQHKGIRKVKGYMFRYIYPLNKKAKKIMKNESSLNWTLDYPKDEELKWIDITDSKNKKIIDKPAFTYEDTKYNSKNINQVSTLESFFG